MTKERIELHVFWFCLGWIFGTATFVFWRLAEVTL